MVTTGAYDDAAGFWPARRSRSRSSPRPTRSTAQGGSAGVEGQRRLLAASRAAAKYGGSSSIRRRQVRKSSWTRQVALCPLGRLVSEGRVHGPRELDKKPCTDIPPVGQSARRLVLRYGSSARRTRGVPPTLKVGLLAAWASSSSGQLARCHPSWIPCPTVPGAVSARRAHSSLRTCVAPHLRLLGRGWLETPAAATRPSRRAGGYEKRSGSEQARDTGPLGAWVVSTGWLSHEYRWAQA